MGRLGSTVEIPESRYRSGRYSPDSYASGGDYRRRRSPNYESYDRYNHHRRSVSPGYTDVRRSPRADGDQNGLPKRFGRTGGRPYLDRNGRASEESDSDEELKGLNYEEYRRLKRQKLRKVLRYCIWRVTPSPPRNDNEEYEEKADDILEKYGDDDGGDKSDSGKKKQHEEKYVSDKIKNSDSDSELSDTKLKRRKLKGSGSRRRSRKSSLSDSESGSDTESESESESEEESRRGRKKSTNRRNRKDKNIRSSNKKKSMHNDTEDSEGSETDDSDDSDRVRSKKRSRTKRSKNSGKKRYSDMDESEESEDEKLRKRKSSSTSSKSRSKRKRQSETESKSSSFEENSGTEDVDASTLMVDGEKMAEINDEALKIKEILEAQKNLAFDNDMPVGPMPLPRAEGHISYGGALRPGEGDAIAQYVQQGKRIPRRGEVGLSADEIQTFETLGYVMSGSRHQRMNAIRIRKENQVYSAEDKRALAMYNYEEKSKRERKVMDDLQRLVQRHIGQDVGPSHDPFAA